MVFPERELGYWTAIRYSSDSIADYVELSDGYAIFEVHVPELWNGLRVGKLNVRRKYHLNILGVREASRSRDKSEMNMDIHSDTVLQKGQTLLVLGKKEDVRKIL